MTGKSRQVRRRACSRDHARELLKELQSGTRQSANGTITVGRLPRPVGGRNAADFRGRQVDHGPVPNIIRTPLKPTLGKMPLQDFTRVKLSVGWRGWTRPGQGAHPEADQGRPDPKEVPGRLLAQSTKRTAYAVLKLALDTAVRDRLIAENPLSEIRRPRKAATVVPVMSAAEVEALLDAAKGTHFEALIVFVANTGCRIGEALALRWSDVDLDNSTATIRRSSINSTTTKTAAGVRTCAAAAGSCGRTQGSALPTAGRPAEDGAGMAGPPRLDLHHRQRDPVDAHNARRNLRSVLKAAGLPQDRPWHTMRHSLATRLLNRGVAMPVVAAILGHASIRTTVDIYGHAEPAINAEALAEVMGR